jgi:hypothetical protein
MGVMWSLVGTKSVKNLISFDVGRWNLVKTTLGSLGLVRTILRTHQEESTESPVHNTDHQELDPER